MNICDEVPALTWLPGRRNNFIIIIIRIIIILLTVWRGDEKDIWIISFTLLRQRSRRAANDELCLAISSKKTRSATKLEEEKLFTPLFTWAAVNLCAGLYLIRASTSFISELVVQLGNRDGHCSPFDLGNLNSINNEMNRCKAKTKDQLASRRWGPGSQQ